MGYKITYGPNKSKSSITKWMGRKLLIRLVIGAMIFSLRYTVVGKQVRQMMIPGDRVVTVAAWDGFREDLADGVVLTDAWHTFCRTIIDNGKVS